MILQIFICSIIFAQSKRGMEWVTGYAGTKVRFEGNSIITSSGVYPFKYFTQGNSNICDTNGNLMMCSDGYNIYDSMGNYLDEGDTLVPKAHFFAQSGWSGYSQTSIFLPMDSDKYYFITPAFSDARYADCNANNHCYFDLLLYNVIDMQANAGAGKVIKRMQPLMENAELRKTQMMACRHSNGKDWWLLKQGGDSNTIYKFLFKQDTVENHGFQQFDYPVWGPWDIRGQSAFSEDGSKYATTSHGGSSGKIFIADFDRCYGILSNPKEILMPVGSHHNPNDTAEKEHLSVGLAYSPNNKFLYVISKRNMYQYDLQDETWYHIAGLDTTFIQFQDYETCYMGQNGRLYIGNFHGGSTQMSVIDSPDVKGVGCSFCPRCLRLDTVGIAGTPPCMPNYTLGAQECWPLSNQDITINHSTFNVYPNPVSNKLKIDNATMKIKTLYNAIGLLILTTNDDVIDVRNYPKGMYYIKCGDQTKRFIVD
jgi:hypothetical protein